MEVLKDGQAKTICQNISNGNTIPLSLNSMKSLQ